MKLFPHFKRRVKDTAQIIKECYSIVTWKNFIWTIPGATLLTLFVSFCMLFEDYDESDAWERKITERMNELEKRDERRKEVPRTFSRTLPEKEWTTLRNFKGNDDHVEYNYFKMTSSDGELLGYCAAERGSENEILIFDSCMEMEIKLEKVSKEEYKEFRNNPPSDPE